MQACGLERPPGPHYLQLKGNKATYHDYGGAIHVCDGDDGDDDGGRDHEFDHILNANLVVADAELGRLEWAKSSMIGLIFQDELDASESDHR